MKIVQVSAYYPPHLGGQEYAVQDLAEQLAASGRNVNVLTSVMGGGKRGVTNENGVAVKRMVGWEFGHAPIMPGFGSALLHLPRKGSVIHLHIGQAFTPEMVWFFCKLRRVPYIAQFHIDFEPSGPAGILLPLYKRFVLGRVLRSAAVVIVLNEKTLQLVKGSYSVRSEVLVMSNGIDEAYFAISRSPHAASQPKQLHLLFVGRLSKQKNLLALLEALAITKRNVHLDIIGEGDQKAKVAKKIKDLKLDNVTTHGRLNRKEVLKFYKNCDALVMPSLYEAQPLVLLEAMAARIPIIGTNVIGVAEHIGGVGIVVEPTAEAIAQGFDIFYAQYSSLPLMVEKGYAKAEKLRWRNLLKKYEALYEEVSNAA